MKPYNNKLFALICLFSMLFFSCEEDILNPHDCGEDIQGTWVRVMSNNPANDGMEVDVSGNSGTVTVGRPSFPVGSIKWQSISGDGPTFTHEELGSDGNYYQASMEIIGDTNYISVSSSGAGNAQKWVRKAAYTIPIDGGGPSAETVTLDCSISGATTWFNGPAAVDYIVPNGCVIDITEALTIEAGTVIQMGENSGLGVYDNGSVKMIGTATAPIIIRGADAASGYWRGIHIETVSVNNVMEYVSIEGAGSNYVYCCNPVASLFLKAAKITIKNSQISNGDEHAIYATSGTEFREYTENTLTTHKEYPMALTLETADGLDGTESSYSGNDEDYVLLLDTDLVEASELKKLNVPYITGNTVYDIKEDLRIAEGVEIVFRENAGIGVFDNGSLTVAGTDGKPVIMRGEENSKGLWRGIHIETNSNKNDINYLEVSQAGSEYVYCCNTVASIFLKDGKAAIKNSTISEGASYGIATQSSFAFSAFENNTITTHTEEPLFITIDQAGQLDGMNSDFSGNGKDYISIQNSQLTASMNLLETNVPYSPVAVIDIIERLVIAPGVEIAFTENTGLGVYDAGVINAVGTASKKIVFRGRTESKGYWRGIHTETNSTDNVLEHVEIKHAGSNYVYCCNQVAGLFVRGGRMLLQNSAILDNDGCGVFVRSGGTLTESGNTFSNNTEGNICN
ncbi:MAG: hypothetical protein AAF696_05690 [Bacteroidota bacterium]